MTITRSVAVNQSPLIPGGRSSNNHSRKITWPVVDDPRPLFPGISSNNNDGNNRNSKRHSVNRSRKKERGQYLTMNRAMVDFSTFRLEVVGGKQDQDQEEEDGASANLHSQRCPIVIKVVAERRMAEEGLEVEVDVEVEVEIVDWITTTTTTTRRTKTTTCRNSRNRRHTPPVE